MITRMLGLASCASASGASCVDASPRVTAVAKRHFRNLPLSRLGRDIERMDIVILPICFGARANSSAACSGLYCRRVLRRLSVQRQCDSEAASEANAHSDERALLTDIEPEVVHVMVH